MKERSVSKIDISNEEIANLSDAEFKTLVIRMLTELVEFGCKLNEKMKDMLRETKENVQGTNSNGKETRTQINSLEQKEEGNIQPDKNEETRIQKNKERLRNLQDTFKRPHIQITGVPEGEEEQQEIKNLVEKHNGELPQSGKGNRLPGSPGSSESPTQVVPKEEHSKEHHNYVT